MTDRPQTVRGHRPVVLAGGDARRPARACARLGIRVRWDMLIEREPDKRRGFWPLALLWLPTGVFATAAVLFWAEPAAWTPMLPASAVSLAPCGLPLALACLQLWRLGWRRAAWAMGAGLGAVTAPLVAGLPGPLAITACAVVISLPAWIAGWWLARRA